MSSGSLEDEQDHDDTLDRHKIEHQANSTTNTMKVQLTTEIGTTEFETEGTATAIPSTALTTDTAGVKIPSPIVYRNQG